MINKSTLSIALIIPTVLIAFFLFYNKAIYLFLLNSLDYRKLPSSQIDAVMTLAFEPERIKKSFEWIERNSDCIWIISIGKHKVEIVQQYKFKDMYAVLSKHDFYDIKNRIITDTTCRNTYEEAMLIAKIAKKNKWKKILIVSAPYHMRRVRFIFEKLRPEAIEYYYDHWEWKNYNQEHNIYLYDSYHRRRWTNPIKMKPVIFCWKFLLREWIKNAYYWIKY